MLRELAVKDFALVDDLRIHFGPGLNVLTGETGAGKSILVDAIALGVGERATSESVRTGAGSAVIEAVFEIGPYGGVRSVAEGMGLEASSALVVRREIARSGPNRCYLNGVSGTLAMLKQLGDRLLDIHGQHEHQSLVHPECHVDFLDGYLGLRDLREAYAQAFREWRRAEARLRQTREALSASEEKADYLRFACEELDRARLSPKEDESLEAARRILANAENLSVGLGTSYELLYEGEGSALDVAGRARKALEGAGRLDPALGSLVGALERGIAELEEVARSVGAYRDRIEYNPDRLEEINARLALLDGLKRRYRTSLGEIMARHREMREELEALEDSENTLEELAGGVAASRARVLEIGRRLLTARSKGASRLGREIASVLGELEMKNARFEVHSDAEASAADEDLLARAEEEGLERVEFLISPNVGEPPKSLARIASGGEISRIMLALKSILVEADEVGTLVFDEIDIGIGGEAARTLAAKLKDLSRARQVLCVTHLPQIASLADRHYAVRKSARGRRTSTEVERLEGQDRLREVARMLAGARPTAAALEHARELMASGGRRRDG